MPPGADFPGKRTFSDRSFASGPVSFKSTSGAICYFRPCPLLRKHQRQGIRTYSTSEIEFVAAPDSIIISSHANFLGFCNRRQRLFEPTEVLWVDSSSAMAVATTDLVKPRSRHYALRWWRVRGSAHLTCFAPTASMRADALNRVPASGPQRGLLVSLRGASGQVIDRSERKVFTNIFKEYSERDWRAWEALSRSHCSAD